MQHSNSVNKKERASSYMKFFRASFVKEVRAMYWSEKYLIKFLARAERAASTGYAKACFKGHKAATSEQIKRLQQIFVMLDIKPSGKTCPEVEGLVKEVLQILKSTDKNSLSRDMGLLTTIQKIEHLEIKKYNNLINIANDLGDYDIIVLLEKTIHEEQEAGETFAAIMEDTLNDERFKIKMIETDEEELEHLEAV